MARRAITERSTSETRLRVELDLDATPRRAQVPGTAAAADARSSNAAADARSSTTAADAGADPGGRPQITARAATGHGFLDHLLEQLTRHGRFALAIEGEGDLYIDVHHLAEDCGITLGQAFSQALGDRAGIERYGDAYVPMDETLAHVVVDLSGRPYLAFDAAGFQGDSGGFNAFHLRELLRGFANHAGATVHVRVLHGEETHHVCEAVMKAFARALRDAVALTHDQLPSTKGLL